MQVDGLGFQTQVGGQVGVDPHQHLAHQRRISPQGIVLDQQAVLPSHLPHQPVDLLIGGGVFDGAGKPGGKVVDVDRVHMAVLSSFSHQGIGNDGIVFQIPQVVNGPAFQMGLGKGAQKSLGDMGFSMADGTHQGVFRFIELFQGFHGLIAVIRLPVSGTDGHGLQPGKTVVKHVLERKPLRLSPESFPQGGEKGQQGRTVPDDGNDAEDLLKPAHQRGRQAVALRHVHDVLTGYFILGEGAHQHIDILLIGQAEEKVPAEKGILNPVNRVCGVMPAQPEKQPGVVQIRLHQGPQPQVIGLIRRLRLLQIGDGSPGHIHDVAGNVGVNEYVPEKEKLCFMLHPLYLQKRAGKQKTPVGFLLFPYYPSFRERKQ